MSFLKDIVKTPQSVVSDWNNFTARSNAQFTSMVPSVTLADENDRILITDYTNFGGIINANNSVPFVDELTVKTSLATFGLYDIELKGRLYELRTFINSGRFKKMFSPNSKFNLYFGWGENIIFGKEAKQYGSLSKVVQCNLINFDINYGDAFSYVFNMKLASNFMNLERNLQVDTLNVTFSADDFKFASYVVENGIRVEKRFTTLKHILEKFKTVLNGISAKNGETPIIKNLDFDFNNAYSGIPEEYFAVGAKNIGNLKISQDSLKSPVLFKGNLRNFITSLINLLDPSVGRKISFYIDEQELKTKITFYNINDEFDIAQKENPIVVKLHSKDYPVKNFNFSYEKPLYALNMLKVNRSGQNIYGEEEKILRSLAKQAGYDFDKFAQSVTGQTLNQVYQSIRQITSDTNDTETPSKAKNRNLGNVLIPFMHLKFEMDSMGFTGFHPGQAFNVQNSLLFEGEYIANEIIHSIKAGEFTTKVSLDCLKPSATLESIFN